jgi:Ribonuclease HII
MTKSEREIFLKNRLEELKSMEMQLHLQGYEHVAGVDEVGRGPLAGPVVAAAVVLPADFDVIGVDDSKKLSAKKREQLYGQILEQALCYGIGQRDNEVIDEINILEATKLAMTDAIAAAEEMLIQRTGKPVDYVLFDAMKIDAVDKPQQSLIKGDSRCVAIAAASIVAKVTRDRMMEEYSRIYPGYGFETNMGYGTKAHYDGISALGVTPIHRMTFLKKLTETN